MSGKTSGTQERAGKGTPIGGQWVKGEVPASVAWNKGAKRAYLKTREATSLRVKAYKTKKKLDGLAAGTPEYDALLKQYELEVAKANNAKKNAEIARKVASHHGFKISANGRVLSAPPLPKESVKPLSVIEEKPSDGHSSSAFGTMKVTLKKQITEMTDDEFAQALLDSPVSGILENTKEFNSNGIIRTVESREKIVRGIHDALGFSGKPKVVEKIGDVDEPLEATVFRGVQGVTKDASKKMFTDFRDGEMYMGRGVYGNGTYTTTDYNAAKFYAGHEYGAVMKLGIPKKYKVVKWEHLNKRLKALAITRLKFSDAKRKQIITDYMRYPDIAAMALGYDGVLITGKERARGGALADGGDFYNIFNRAGLYMEKNPV